MTLCLDNKLNLSEISSLVDIIRDSRRWLIIAGQENKAFAAHSPTALQE